MDMLPVMLFFSLVLGLIALGGFLWGIKKGEFDDPEGMRYRVLMDDEEEDRRFLRRIRGRRARALEPPRTGSPGSGMGDMM